MSEQPHVEKAVEAGWKADIKLCQAAERQQRLDGARRIHDRLEQWTTNIASPQPLPSPIQQSLINALLHLLHERDPAVTTASSSSPSDSAASAIHVEALNILSLLLSSASLLEPQRRSVLLRKADEIRWNIKSQAAEKRSMRSEQAERLNEILDRYESEVHELKSTTDADADSAAASSKQQEKERRRALRQAKEQRKQIQAAEKRRKKNMLMEHKEETSNAQVDELQDKMAASSMAHTAAASDMKVQPVSVSSTSPPRPSSSWSCSDVIDGSESAPFGNFHNYYAFNVPDERLQYIPRDMIEHIMQAKRRCQKSQSTQCATSTGMDMDLSFNLLDIGCNEGDLTIGLVQHFLPTLIRDNMLKDDKQCRTNENDAQQRDETQSHDADALSSSSSSTSSSGSAAHSSSCSNIIIHAIGVDIDPVLIARAQSKVEQQTESWKQQQLDHPSHAMAPSSSSPSTSSSPSSIPSVPTLQFRTLDVMQDGATDVLLQMLMESHHTATIPTAAVASISSINFPTSSPPFDLITCWSLTLWIHLHHGDEGLQRFLRLVCRLSRNVLIEAQPWSCYRNARERWRRKGKEDPPMLRELKWRTDVDERICEFLVNECGMRLRAELGSTKWKRHVRWFERVDTEATSSSSNGADDH